MSENASPPETPLRRRRGGAGQGDEEEKRRGRWIAASIAFALTCASLAWGSGFDLDPFDSAELALAAVTRGLAHPPGQPLHTLLGWIVTRLPFRPLGLLVWLSIAPAAGMAWGSGSGAGLGQRSGSSEGSGQRSGSSEGSCQRSGSSEGSGSGQGSSEGLRLRRDAMAAIAAGLVFAALPDVRSVACRIEVYALAALFAVAAVVFASRRTARNDFAAGVSLGLAACVNPVLAAQGVGALAAAWRSTRRESVLAMARIAGGAVVGLVPYVYVVAVASRVRDTLVWGAPADAHGWMRLLTAADFRRNVSASPGTLFANAAHFAWDAAARGAMVVIVAGIVAASFDRRGDRWRRVTAIVASLVLGLFMVAANVPYLANNPDYGGYLLVPIALSLHAIVDAAARSSRTRITAGLSSAVAIAALALGIAQRGPRGVTRMLATEVLTAAPDHAIVVLGSDHLLFPALYIQRVEGLRTDVTILNPGWASARWAWTWAQAHDPGLRVDYSPGRGETRLNRALAARDPGRAVMAESPAALRVAAPGPVCLRGLLWSSAEGCIGSRRWIERTTTLLAEASSRASDRGWDARLVYFTGRSLGDAARSLGCAGLGSLLYRAARGDVDEGSITSFRCTGEPLRVPPPVSVLDVTRADLPTRAP